MSANCLKTIVVCIKGGYYSCLGDHGQTLSPYNQDGGTLENPAKGSISECYGDVFARAYVSGGQQGAEALARCLERGDLAIKQSAGTVFFDTGAEEIKVLTVDKGKLSVVDPTIS
jgi:hypothetical protein|tara:strand:+ start:3689 stop:4033 length:345 start_codon:yes stop_codon:yes gene_type:complete